MEMWKWEMLNGLQFLNTYGVVEAGLSETGQKVVAPDVDSVAHNTCGELRCLGDT